MLNNTSLLSTAYDDAIYESTSRINNDYIQLCLFYVWIKYINTLRNGIYRAAHRLKKSNYDTKRAVLCVCVFFSYYIIHFLIWLPVKKTRDQKSL